MENKFNIMTDFQQSIDFILQLSEQYLSETHQQFTKQHQVWNQQSYKAFNSIIRKLNFQLHPDRGLQQSDTESQGKLNLASDLFKKEFKQFENQLIFSKPIKNKIFDYWDSINQSYSDNPNMMFEEVVISLFENINKLDKKAAARKIQSLLHNQQDFDLFNKYLNEKYTKDYLNQKNIQSYNDFFNVFNQIYPHKITIHNDLNTILQSVIQSKYFPKSTHDLFNKLTQDYVLKPINIKVDFNSINYYKLWLLSQFDLNMTLLTPYLSNKSFETINFDKKQGEFILHLSDNLLSKNVIHEQDKKLLEQLTIYLVTNRVLDLNHEQKFVQKMFSKTSNDYQIKIQQLRDDLFFYDMIDKIIENPILLSTANIFSNTPNIDSLLKEWNPEIQYTTWFQEIQQGYADKLNRPFKPHKLLNEVNQYLTNEILPQYEPSKQLLFALRSGNYDLIDSVYDSNQAIKVLQESNQYDISLSYSYLKSDHYLIGKLNQLDLLSNNKSYGFDFMDNLYKGGLSQELQEKQEYELFAKINKQLNKKTVLSECLWTINQILLDEHNLAVRELFKAYQEKDLSQIKDIMNDIDGGQELSYQGMSFERFMDLKEWDNPEYYSFNIKVKAVLNPLPIIKKYQFAT